MKNRKEPKVWINTTVGTFDLSCKPNKSYKNEIMIGIGDKRFDLPRGIVFDDVITLTIYQGIPTIGMLEYYEKDYSTSKLNIKKRRVIFREQSFSRGFYFMDFID